MSPLEPQRRRPRPACLVPAGAFVLALAVGAPTAATADQVDRGRAAGDTPSLSAELQVSSATEWYTSGQFVVRNTGDAPADWTLRFAVPTGSFSNWADWMTETERSGDTVTIRSRPDQRLAAGSTAAVSFGISGDGTAVPTVEHCDLDGADVQNCTAVPGDGGGDPGPGEGDGSEDADTTAPTAVTDLTADATGPTSVELGWTPATDDTGVTGYEVSRPGVEPIALPAEATSTTVTGLQADTEHVFTVTAHDAAGNRGPATDVSVRTPAAPVEEAVLRVHADHSEVPVAGTTRAEAARAAEDRWFRHSELQPTGRYVRAGDVVEVDVPDGLTGLDLVIGLHGVHDGQNGGEERAMQAASLRPGTDRVTAEQDGMVFVRTTAGQAGEVEVRGGSAVATFVRGGTTVEEFRAQLSTFDSPFVSFVGDRVAGDFQRASYEQALGSIDVAERVASWDAIVETTDRVWGLDAEHDGTAARAGHRVYIANPTRLASATAYANAGNDRINFPVSTGAGKEVLTAPLTAQWALWHEIGHTYQPDWIRWSGMTEVTVNVSALAHQESVGAANRLDTEAMRKAHRAFRATPKEDRSFTSISDPFLRLLMFDQLRRAFGDDLYARAAQQVRVDRALGQLTPASDAGRQAVFVRAVALAADRDLTPFFEEWGFPLADDTRALLADLPELQVPIWENHDRATDRVERVVTYTPTTGGATIDADTAVFGQRALHDGQVHHDDTVTPGRTGVVATTVGTAAGSVAAEMLAADGTPNAVRTTVDVRRGSMVEFQGEGDRPSAAVVLDPSTHELGVERLSSRAVHSRFPGRYFGATLIGADGRTVGSGYQNGTETSGAFWNRFDGTPYHDGQFLVLDHEEPRNRLVRWSDDVQLAGSAAKEQAFRIDGTALVPVPLSEVPGR